MTSFESTNYEATLRRTEQFAVGSQHRVRYDAANPSQARLGAGWNRTFFALPLIVAGHGGIFRLRRGGVPGDSEGRIVGTPSPLNPS